MTVCFFFLPCVWKPIWGDIKRIWGQAICSQVRFKTQSRLQVKRRSWSNQLLWTMCAHNYNCKVSINEPGFKTYLECGGVKINPNAPQAFDPPPAAVADSWPLSPAQLSTRKGLKLTNMDCYIITCTPLVLLPLPKTSQHLLANT